MTCFVDTERRDIVDRTDGIASSSASVPETTVSSWKEDGPPVLEEYLIDEGCSLFFLLRLPELGAGWMHLMQDPRRVFHDAGIGPVVRRL
jgi:hypothetical protein